MPRKRKTRRRRRRGLLGRLLRPLSVILAAVAIVAALTLFFKVEKVEISGNSRYLEEDIIAAAGVEQGDNLILLNRYGISQRLCSRMPYITEAHVYPKFPDTLVIEVAETQAAAAIGGGGAYWLLSAGEERIKILEMVDAASVEDYLLITGLTAEDPETGGSLKLEEGSRLSVEKLLELLRSLDRRNMVGRVDSISAEDPDKLILGYDGRFQVEIGYHADLDFKLNCLQEAVKQLEPNETGIIRMTMEDDMKVRFIPANH